MKYYLIAGEASGDLHASHLMTSLKHADAHAEFRFFGGDNMAAAAQGCGVLVKHYREMAYMGFLPVLRHLPTIMRNMRLCREDIISWEPDCVIFVDYADFNLRIAKYLRQHSRLKLFYYISPKIWAWKEWRIKNFKRDIDEMFSILPFEKDFFETKHHYPVHYVGNPTACEVRDYMALHPSTLIPQPSSITPQPSPLTPQPSTLNHQPSPLTPQPITTIALLAGSRRQEIKENLPAMIDAVTSLPQEWGEMEIVVAGAPGIEKDYYDTFLRDHPQIEIVFGRTYDLLSRATAALVTSGTATLETCCFNVPQVVCYHTSPARLTRWAFDHILSCKYISLVNLIADREVVPELFADRFSVDNIRRHLMDILPGGKAREAMLKGYEEVHRRLGNDNAPDNAAAIIYKQLQKNT